MLRRGEADALIGGLTRHYPEVIRPALQVIPIREGLKKVCGVYVLITQQRDIYFLADATVNIEPSVEDLAEIALGAAQVARRFGQEPRVALLSFSNFGSTRHPLAEKVARAVALVRQRDPHLMVDGEMQADTALSQIIRDKVYPGSRLRGEANILIMPSLDAANIAFQLVKVVADALPVGPILMGAAKPAHILTPSVTARGIVNMTAIAVAEAQARDKWDPA